MIKKFAYKLLCILPFLLFRCGETNYILNDQTPSNLEGFFGFRWTTPMEIVDSEFPKRTGARKQSGLNRYNTSNFSNAVFLGETTSSCRFKFNERGLTSVKILFDADHMTIDEQLYNLIEKLSDVYGKPIEVHGIIKNNRPPEYLVRYTWIEARLDIILNLDYTLEVNAYSFSPLLGPIFNDE